MPLHSPNASIAVVASDEDILLFFKCVFEQEFCLSLFLNSQIEFVVEHQDEFDFVVIDFACALEQAERGRWNAMRELFKDRIFLLTSDLQIADYYKRFAGDARAIPYPFTKQKFYLFLKNERPPSRPKNSLPAQFKKGGDSFKLVPQFSRLAGSCEKLNETKRKILMAADTDTPLIFFGESGTGKTLAAQITHELSPRKDKPFIIANMANGNRELFESLLFGSVRGAFTDARDREGLFKKADGGTLFMDEIAELSLDCQAKLLRAIESGSFRPVGSDEEIKSDARLIFATNADLAAMVRNKAFREDLYWRIVDFPIEFPSLRERSEDFPLLIENALKEIRQKHARHFSITKEAVEKMRECEWPGNFRQFNACLRRAAILSRDTGIIDEDSISF